MGTSKEQKKVHPPGYVHSDIDDLEENSTSRVFEQNTNKWLFRISFTTVCSIPVHCRKLMIQSSYKVQVLSCYAANVPGSVNSAGLVSRKSPPLRQKPWKRGYAPVRTIYLLLPKGRPVQI